VGDCCVGGNGLNVSLDDEPRVGDSEIEAGFKMVEAADHGGERNLSIGTILSGIDYFKYRAIVQWVGPGFIFGGVVLAVMVFIGGGIE